MFLLPFMLAGSTADAPTGPRRPRRLLRILGAPLVAALLVALGIVSSALAMSDRDVGSEDRTTPA